MILDSPPAGVEFRDSARATRDDPVRSSSPVVKTEASATPVIANIPQIPALSALLADVELLRASHLSLKCVTTWVR